MIALLSEPTVLDYNMSRVVCAEALQYTLQVRDRFAFPDQSEAIADLVPILAQIEGSSAAMEVIRKIEDKDYLPRAPSGRRSVYAQFE